MSKIKGWEKIDENKFMIQWASGKKRVGRNIKVTKNWEKEWKVVEWYGNPSIPSSPPTLIKIVSSKERARKIANEFMRSHPNG